MRAQPDSRPIRERMTVAAVAGGVVFSDLVVIRHRGGDPQPAAAAAHHVEGLVGDVVADAPVHHAALPTAADRARLGGWVGALAHWASLCCATKIHCMANQRGS